MKPTRCSFLLCSATAVAAFVIGCTAQHTRNQPTVRQKFVPAIYNVGTESSPNRASWTALVPLKDGSGVSRLIANAGIGDHFPVAAEKNRCLFEVVVREGDDNRLLLDVCSVEGSQRVALVRDKPVWVQIGKGRYNLVYPAVTVDGTKSEQHTTEKAMLLIHYHQ